MTEYYKNIISFICSMQMNSVANTSVACLFLAPPPNTLPHRTERVFSHESFSKLRVRSPTHRLPDVLTFF